MLYKHSVLIPPNTSKSNRKRKRVRLTRGTIRRFFVGFPPGCGGLAGLQIRHGGWNLLPWTPGEWLAWDNFMFMIDYHYPLTAEPYSLVIQGYNEDDSYEHTLLLGIEFEAGVVDPRMARFFDDITRMVK